ncbi:MAG: hypothetical protein B7X51_12620 [Pseudomonas sp. 34-62-33]|nr:MAG: hypothetical protein B7X51_12620 [Pseudomonas sp. 34-62-33]
MARILIVDDSPTEMYKLTAMLENKDAETSHIPVIIVTTKDQETDKVWGKRQGAKDYLTKPIDEDTLLKTLNAVLAG